MDTSTQLSKEDCASTPEEIATMRHKPYCTALGALMYATVATCPDISYVVSQLARYQAILGVKH